MTVVISFVHKTAKSDKRNDKGNAVIGQHEPKNKSGHLCIGVSGMALIAIRFMLLNPAVSKNFTVYRYFMPI